jgi:hemerythrin
MKDAKERTAAGPQPARVTQKTGEEIPELPRVGVAEIDADHHRLVVRYRTLMRAVNRVHDPHRFALMFHIFILQVRRHFEREELLMEGIGYPHYDHHRFLHRKLMRDAEDFLVDLIKGEEEVSAAAATNYLEHWLINHIASHDLRIGEFLMDDMSPS